jgi:hypothetical protein
VRSHSEHRFRVAKVFRLGAKKSRGAVGLKLGRARERGVTMGREYFVIQVACCRDLERADPFSLSDPYCKVLAKVRPGGYARPRACTGSLTRYTRRTRITQAKARAWQLL